MPNLAIGLQYACYGANNMAGGWNRSYGAAGASYVLCTSLYMLRKLKNNKSALPHNCNVTIYSVRHLRIARCLFR